MTIKNQQIQGAKYANQIITKREATSKGQQVATEGLWQEVVLNYLKSQSLVFISQTLTELKIKAIGWTIDLTNWLLTNLESYLLSLYQQATNEEKKLFKTKMTEHFPNSQLTNKL